MSTHQRRNDAQLAHYRRNQPELWERLLASLNDAERADVIARSDAAELDAFAIEWDRRAEALGNVAAALASKAPTPPRPHVTAQMIADIWRDENGPERVADILRTLDEATRARVAVDYWNLLRQRGHSASLVEVGIQLCVVERLAA